MIRGVGCRSTLGLVTDGGIGLGTWHRWGSHFTMDSFAIFAYSSARKLFATCFVHQCGDRVKVVTEIALMIVTNSFGAAKDRQQDQAKEHRQHQTMHRDQANRPDGQKFHPTGLGNPDS